ncbi:MAG: LamG-like jellyroll fold domain-containing protein [Candidatus Micrarchaeia archaeon]
MRSSFFAAQSAMEYLMTYGWAILIIAVALGALYELGIFSPSAFAPKAPPGACQVFRPDGPYTTTFISLAGSCSGEVPQYVAEMNGNSYINGTLASGFIPNSPISITLTAWVYDPSGANLAPIAVGSYSYGCTTHLYEAGLNSVSTNTIRYHGCCYDYQASPFNNVNLGDGRWHFLALSYSYPAQRIIFMVDNNTQIDPWSSAPTLGALAFWLGRDMCDKWYTSGYMSNLQVYNTSLSANSLRALYLEGIGGAPIRLQNLVAWWPLNGNAEDYSGNGNNGAPIGITYVSNWYSGYTPP